MNSLPKRELPIAQFRPAPAATFVVVVLPLPRELDSIFRALGAEAEVEFTLDSAKLEVAKTVFLKFDVAGNNQIDVVTVPLLHLEDAPAAEERICFEGRHICR